MTEHPDLIDAEGERWRWTVEPIEMGGDEGYAHHALFCLYQRDVIEREFGPVRESPDLL